MIHLAWYAWAFVVAFVGGPVVAVLFYKYVIWVFEKLMGIK